MKFIIHYCQQFKLAQPCWNCFTLAYKFEILYTRKFYLLWNIWQKFNNLYNSGDLKQIIYSNVRDFKIQNWPNLFFKIVLYSQNR